MTSWTSIATATTTYTYVNVPGRQMYDDDLTYDDANTYYDSINPNMYTKASSVLTSWTSIQS